MIIYYTVNLRTKILDLRWFDSSRILILRGGILMSIGNFPESLSQAILVGRFLVGRLGVAGAECKTPARPLVAHGRGRQKGPGRAAFCRSYKYIVSYHSILHYMLYYIITYHIICCPYEEFTRLAETRLA